MTAQSEAAGIFYALILVACAVGIIYGAYLAIATPNKVEGIIMLVVGAIVAAFLL